MASSVRQKIIIDTDCGIDDAIALLLALSSNEVAEIIAITCCFGNTKVDNVVSNVKRVLTVCEERNIPVHKGCTGTLISNNSKHSTVHGSDGLGEFAEEFPTGDLKTSDVPAVIALIEYAKKYPREITVIAIGPLTNLAVAHRADPSFTRNLKAISIMGGNYKGIGNVTEVAEFNFHCDPESAHIIVSEAFCTTKLVPWETTMEFGIPWDVHQEMSQINTRKGRFFKRIASFFKRKRDTFPDCDFLAVVNVLYPQAVKNMKLSRMIVEYSGRFTKGLTVLLKSSSVHSNKIQIITEYDKEILNFIRKQMLSKNQIYP